MPAELSAARILVVEDEADLRFLLRQNLEGEGYAVVEAATLAAGERALQDELPALILLDLNLPDGEGFDLLRRLRARHVWTPTVFLSARDAEADRLRGFSLGGDDYVTKPFSMAELLARVAAIVRRSRREASAVYTCAGFQVDFDRYLLRAQGEERPLTYLEAELLRALVQRAGQPVSRLDLLNEVWGYDRYPTTRTVDMHVLNLRKKLEPDPKRPRHLLTVHGVGYKFVP